MRYMLLMHGRKAAWDAMPEQDRDEVLRLHAALVEELRGTGEFLGGAGLTEAEQTVTVRGDPPATMEGPLAEGEQFSAFYLVECDSIERACELAERTLDPHVQAVEVRPVHSFEPLA